MGHCSNYSAVSRNWIGNSDWYLAHRTGYDSSGRGIHGGRHTEHFNSTFRDQCDNWIKNLNFWTQNYGGRTVAWVGDVGVGVCKTGMHGQARAFDLTQIRFTNGTYSDMNWSWRQNTLHKRRYLAVAAQCRRYFGTVLTCWYDSAHHNHIHFDNGTAVTYIRTSSTYRSDITLVQASCNLLNGESLAIDGSWGSLTESAYQRLLTKFNMRCYNPKTNVSHAKIFLSYIVRHGFANAAAGTYRAGC